MATITLPASAAEVIPYQKFTLDNGLRVIVHEDRKAPVVHLGVWYHVGSKDEPRGQTGFAHLYEHLMFRGSENFNGGYADVLQQDGATGLNGTTWLDRTNYFQTVPTPALERVLWLESDRMGHLLGAVTQQALDDERGVVQNEKRQREGAPMGRLVPGIQAGLFPPGHPYHHSTIGSMEDLNAASLEDVHAWFREYYGAANAVLVFSGDIDAPRARELADKYFGDIPAGPPQRRLVAQVPERRQNTREVMYDKIPEPMLVRAWAIPPRREKDSVLLGIVATALSGKSSRLYQELVEKRAVATNVRVSVMPNEIASIFTLHMNVKSGVTLERAQQALDETMAAFLAQGLTEQELQRVKDEQEAQQIRALEDVMAKGIALAEGELYNGDPGYLTRDDRWVQATTAADVRAVTRQWLSSGYHQIDLMPTARYQTKATTVDRSAMPPVKNELKFDLPPVQRATLSNGIQVVLTERHQTPTVELLMIFNDISSLTDDVLKHGVAGMAFGLIQEGPQGFTAAQFADAKRRLGMDGGAGAGYSNSFCGVSVLKKNLVPSLALWNDMIRKPAFRAEDLKRTQEAVAESARYIKNDARSISTQIMQSALYGEGHPQAPRWDEAQLTAKLTVEDLKAFHRKWVHPRNVTVLVVGDTTLAEITPLLERQFSDWKSSPGDARASDVIPPLPAPQRPRVILVNVPNSPQTTILAGRLLPLKPGEEEYARLEASNHVFGGNGLVGRLGKNLRVEKGWSYGASSRLAPLVNHTHWMVTAPVQADKTAESVAEILKELQGITHARPVDDKELTQYVRSATLSLPGRFEKATALMFDMWGNHNAGMPLDFTEGAPARLAALRIDTVNVAARKYLEPRAMTWVIAGDLAQFEQKVRDLGIGDVEIWDTDGKIVSGARP